MGLFGFGSKRSPLPQPPAPRPRPSTVASTSTSTVMKVRSGLPTKWPGASAPADVEVSELNLDEAEFCSTFGAGASRFAETDLGPGDVSADPWTSRLRLD